MSITTKKTLSLRCHSSARVRVRRNQGSLGAILSSAEELHRVLGAEKSLRAPLSALGTDGTHVHYTYTDYTFRHSSTWEVGRKADLKTVIVYHAIAGSLTRLGDS